VGGCGVPERAPHGRALQVDPIKPPLKPPGTKRLILKYDELVSSYAFNVSLRRYNTDLLRVAVACCAPRGWILATESLRSEKMTMSFRRVFGAPGLFAVRVLGRGLHSSSFPLNLSLPCPFPLDLSLLLSPI